jgi:hypothetical protein
MSLTGKDIGRGIGYPTRPSQSKGTSSRLGGRILGESKNLLCSEGAVIRNVDDMFEGCINLHKGSRIDKRWNWYDHFFDHWLKRMCDNRDRGNITLDNEVVVRRRLQRHYCHVNQRRNMVWGNHKCLRIRRALR